MKFVRECAIKNISDFRWYCTIFMNGDSIIYNAQYMVVFKVPRKNPPQIIVLYTFIDKSNFNDSDSVITTRLDTLDIQGNELSVNLTHNYFRKDCYWVLDDTQIVKRIIGDTNNIRMKLFLSNETDPYYCKDLNNCVRIDSIYLQNNLDRTIYNAYSSYRGFGFHYFAWKEDKWYHQAYPHFDMPPSGILDSLQSKEIKECTPFTDGSVVFPKNEKVRIEFVYSLESFEAIEMLRYELEDAPKKYSVNIYIYSKEFEIK
jgi:hypothetical protein